VGCRTDLTLQCAPLKLGCPVTSNTEFSNLALFDGLLSSEKSDSGASVDAQTHSAISIWQHNPDDADGKLLWNVTSTMRCNRSHDGICTGKCTVRVQIPSFIVLNLIVLYLSSTSAVPRTLAVRYQYHCIVSGVSGSTLQTNHQWSSTTTATVSLLSVPNPTLDSWTALQSCSRQRERSIVCWGLSVCLSVRLWVCLSICLSVCLSNPVCHITLADVLLKVLLRSVKTHECLSFVRLKFWIQSRYNCTALKCAGLKLIRTVHWMLFVNTFRRSLYRQTDRQTDLHYL
jgi:hypothetical protein